MKNITPVNKDILLKILCENFEPETLYIPRKKVIADETGINDIVAINAMLQQFVRMGLLEKAVENNQTFNIIIRAEAIDFFNRGGFAMQEELLVRNIEKLLNEIENLKPNTLEETNYITSIATAILSFYSFLSSK